MTRISSTRRLLGAALASLLAVGAHAQNSPAAAASAPAWNHVAKHLHRDEIDALLAHPEKLLVLDIRRPDELIRYGSFPAFLNIQFKDLDKQLAYLPRDRVIIAVSNHAVRAGVVADALIAKGYQVAGAAGSEDYEKEGGKAVAHIQAPPPRNAGAAASSPAPTP